MANITNQTDHNYSLIVRNEPEVEIETIVETTEVPFQSREENVFSIIDSSTHGLLNGNTQTIPCSSVLNDNIPTTSTNSVQMIVSPNKSFNLQTHVLSNAQPLSKLSYIKLFSQHLIIIL